MKPVYNETLDCNQNNHLHNPSYFIPQNISQQNQEQYFKKGNFIYQNKDQQQHFPNNQSNTGYQQKYQNNQSLLRLNANNDNLMVNLLDVHNPMHAVNNLQELSFPVSQVNQLQHPQHNSLTSIQEMKLFNQNASFPNIRTFNRQFEFQSQERLNSQLACINQINYQKQEQHQISLNCLRKCSQWHMQVKVNNKRLCKVQNSGIALRQNGSIKNGASQFTKDILDALIETENELSCQQFESQQQQEIIRQKLHLKEFNGYVHQSQQIELSLPLDNQEPGMNSKFVDILKDQKCESMFCLEFDVQKLLFNDPLSNQSYEHRILRVINQELVESTLHFFINGCCHGQKILASDLHFQLQGKKIVKSIQQRIIDYKEYLCQQIRGKILEYQNVPIYGNDVTSNLKHLINQLKWLNKKGIGPFLQRQTTLHSKMVNLTKSIGIEVNYQNFENIEYFLTNFNQIVLQEGRINKFMFCFDIPLSQFVMKNHENQSIPKALFTPPNHNTLQVLRDCSNYKNPIANNSTLKSTTPQKVMNLWQEYVKLKSLENHESPKLFLIKESQPLQVLQQSTPLATALIYSPIFSSQILLPQTQTNIETYLLQEACKMNAQQKRCNFDKLIEFTTPCIAPDMTFSQFFDLFENSCCFGLKIEFQDPLNDERYIYTFLPTLSSLYVNYYTPIHQLQKSSTSISNNQNQSEDDQIRQAFNSFDIDEFLNKDDQISQCRSGFYFQEAQTPLNNDLSTISQRKNISTQLVEFHEASLPYERIPLYDMINILQNSYNIHDIDIQKQIDHESSWFAILWSCQRFKTINRQSNQTFQQPSTFQLYIVYRFCPPIGSLTTSIEVIGIIPYKMERQSFWLQPCNISKDQMNNTSLVNKFTQENKLKIQGLQDRVNEFMNSENQLPHDFLFFKTRNFG